MNHGLNKIGARTKLLVCALAVAAAGVSHAQTTLVGGGATLPAIGYVGTGAESNHQVNPAGTGSLFAVYSAISGNPTVSYCQTGSGTGKNVLALVSGDSVQNACTPSPTGVYDGFGAAAAGRTLLTQPNFAAADSPLAQSDFTNYTTGHSGNLPVQFPSVAGAISLAMNLKSANGVVMNKGNTNFSDAQVCLIFSGQATDWSDSRLATAFSLASGDSVSGAINVQYRSDGSGTSFAFSNYLSNICAGTASTHFVTSQTFWANTAATPTPTTIDGLYFPSGLPTNWTGSSGNPAVASAIALTSNSIGYVETANTEAANLSYALVDSEDPEANFGGTKFVVSNSGTGANLLYNTVINGANATTGRPVLQPLSTTPPTSCIALVDPSSYAKPATGYPIMAVSYLLGNTNGNGSDLAATQGLLSAPYNTAVTNSRSLTLFGVNKGLELLNAGTSITPAIVSACLVN
jgi:phosphate transport system substrate-binding protein